MFFPNPDKHPIFTACVYICGAIALKILLFRLFCFLWRVLYPYVFARQPNLHKLSGQCEWALVTGCTQGIGRAYAEALGKQGFSLVLVSRSAQKLAQMEQEMRAKFPKIDVLCVPFDFSEPSVEAYEANLLKKIEHLDIGILINNVGAMYTYPQRFHDAEGSLKRIAETMTINMFPVTLLTAHLLERMMKRGDGHGVIVNISSLASYKPYFHVALYSATKIYINWLSAALRKDYAPQKGIIIQTICPGPVITELSRVLTQGKKSSFFMPSPEQFVRSAIRTIGHSSETAGCMGHQLLVRALPKKKIDKAND